MPLSIAAFIDVLATICEERNLKCAVKSSLKGGLITGVSACVGGLLLGPVGLAIGGALGGTACAISAEKFQPVAVVLREMSPEHKKRLYQKILIAVKDFGPQDVASLAALLISQESIKSIAIREITNYLMQDMAYSVK